MTNTHETIADIAAEKRRIAKEIRDYASNGDYWDKKRAYEAAEDLEEEADRFEAAHKRERNRNFHRFATAEEAAKAWHEREAKDMSEEYCAGCAFDLGVECAKYSVCTIGWLYAEAQEGGANV